MITITHILGVRWSYNSAFVLDKWSVWHLLLAEVIAFIVMFFFGAFNGFVIALLLGILWEVADGFKPLYFWRREQSGLREHILFSDGFSYSDVIYDAVGALIGSYGFSYLTAVVRANLNL